jgi:hypothetical protein
MGVGFGISGTLCSPLRSATNATAAIAHTVKKCISFMSSQDRNFGQNASHRIFGGKSFYGTTAERL